METRSRSSNNIAILSSDGTQELAGRIQAGLRNKSLSCPHILIKSWSFNNEEEGIHIPFSVRRRSVYFVHCPQLPNPNTGIIQALFAAEAGREGGAQEWVHILPFIPYMRQDRKDRPRVPISAKAIAEILSKNADRIFTLDLHVEQAPGFFDIPVENLSARYIFAKYFRKRFKGDISNIVIVAPDAGAHVRATRFAEKLGKNVEVGVLRKSRQKDSKVKIEKYIGPDLTGKIAVQYDDINDTGNTNIEGVRFLRELRPKEVLTCFTHAIFSHDGVSSAEDKMRAEGVETVTTDSIPRNDVYIKKGSIETFRGLFILFSITH
ncbi:MAG: hypothetical protein COV70_01475 [Parcubacteria group bacterium CG11_big_fil_rev_8_21_14_0_20_39_22]|nr:MAG: hypothetical protein COV70_01475 [Parcubacteria group bacterium CG11_big_fil_rev_8_21_14_0_20_39_22]